MSWLVVAQQLAAPQAWDMQYLLRSAVLALLVLALPTLAVAGAPGGEEKLDKAQEIGSELMSPF